MGVGRRPVGALARGLRLRAAVLRQPRRLVRLHAGLLVAARDGAERLERARSSRRSPADRRAAAGLAHAADERRWRWSRSRSTTDASAGSPADRAAAADD